MDSATRFIPSSSKRARIGFSLPPAAADPWVDVIEHLADDEAAYARASLAAREIATRHLPAVTGPRYAAWFGAMSGRSTGGDREPGR